MLGSDKYLEKNRLGKRDWLFERVIGEDFTENNWTKFFKELRELASQRIFGGKSF